MGRTQLWAKRPAIEQATGSGNVYIGTGVPGVNGENNACYIASIFGQTPKHHPCDGADGIGDIEDKDAKG